METADPLDSESGDRFSLSQLADEFRSADTVARALWGVVLLVGILDLYQYYRRGFFGVDFATVWIAAHALFQHHTRWGQFDYLPGCLILVLPLAVMPLRLARTIVYGVQFVGIGYAVWAVTRITRQSLGSRSVAGLGIVMVVAGQVGVVSNYENFTLLLVPLAAAFFLYIDRGNPTAAAIALGLSLTIKPLLLPLLVVLVLRSLWRSLTIALTIPAALSTLALAAISLNGSPTRLVHEVLTTFTSNNTALVNISISGVGHILSLPVGVIDVVRVVVVLACVGVCRRLWMRPIGGQGEQAIWTTAPLLVGMIVCFTFSWAYYAVLLLPLALITLGRPDWGSRVIQIGVVLALLFPLLPDLTSGFPSAHASDVIALLGLGIVLVGTASVSLAP